MDLFIKDLSAWVQSRLDLCLKEQNKTEQNRLAMPVLTRRHLVELICRATVTSARVLNAPQTCYLLKLENESECSGITGNVVDLKLLRIVDRLVNL